MKKERVMLIGSIAFLFPVLEFFFKDNFFNFYAHTAIVAVAVGILVFIFQYIKKFYLGLAVLTLLLVFSLTSWTGNWHEVGALFR
ncbi:hypothetical protein ACSU64_27190 [Bacillaceae bacterium C204]|uniref:hypothetical protein n=1 Tax=Neobacillus sp. 204 TaxID=3383351 RepID=UPI00397AA80A